MATSLKVDNGTGLNGYVDTLAQSFFVDRQIMVSRIDLFFSNADAKRPVQLNLRKIENNEPSSNVIGGSDIVLAANALNTSANGFSNTSFTFNSPIFLDIGQYAFCLSSDSGLNKVHTGDLGVADLITGEAITKNERSGTLYKSTNGLVWDQDITRDIKYKLFRANVTSTTGTVDLIPNRNNIGTLAFTSKILPSYPFKSYNATDVVKVKHPRHGFRSGDVVKFRGLNNEFRLKGNANADVTYNGIPYAEIGNVSLTVGNVTSDSYTVVLGSNAFIKGNITAGTFGGGAVMATTYTPYNAFYPALGLVTPPGTGVDHKVKTTDTDLTVSGFESIDPQNAYFTETKLIVDAANRTASMSNAESLVYRVELSTDNTFLSPQLRLPYASLMMFTNDINNPSSSDNLDLDSETIVSSNVQISFDDAGQVSVGGLLEQANVKTMVPGAFVDISGASNSNNNGTFRIVSVNPAGTSFNIPISNTEAAGSSITITYDPEFISDLAATGSSSRAKYITREIELDTPATGIMIRFTVAKPTGAYIEAYYRTSNDGETIPLKDKEYNQVTLPTITDTLPDEFVEVEALVDDIESFDAFALKLVLKGDSIGQAPTVKDLRVIALA